jgi:hypothetical protein
LIKLNLRSGDFDRVHEVNAVFLISEMERRVRQVVGTQEQALRLLRGGLLQPPSAEQEQAVQLSPSALFQATTM